MLDSKKIMELEGVIAEYEKRIGKYLEDSDIYINSEDTFIRNLVVQQYEDVLADKMSIREFKVYLERALKIPFNYFDTLDMTPLTEDGVTLYSRYEAARRIISRGMLMHRGTITEFSEDMFYTGLVNAEEILFMYYLMVIISDKLYSLKIRSAIYKEIKTITSRLNTKIKEFGDVDLEKFYIDEYEDSNIGVEIIKHINTKLFEWLDNSVPLTLEWVDNPLEYVKQHAKIENMSESAIKKMDLMGVRYNINQYIAIEVFRKILYTL